MSKCTALGLTMAAIDHKPHVYVHSDYTKWERKGWRSGLEYKSVVAQLSALSLTHKVQPIQEGNQGQTHYAFVKDPAPCLLLKATIAQKQNSRDNYKSHLIKLQEQNVKLLQAIQSTDKTTHGKVSRSLDKYHKFKGVLTKVREAGASEINNAREELEDIQKRIKTMLIKLNQEVYLKEAEVTKCNTQLHTLVNYKDKDYPLKQVKIENLHMTLEYLDELHQREEIDLEQSLQEERMKFDKKINEIKLQLEAEASKNWMRQMKRDVFARAVHNKVMEKELDLQTKLERQLLSDIEKLKSQIQFLSLVTQNLAPSQSFASPLSKLGKCTPETEICLNIPRQNELPV